MIVANESVAREFEFYDGLQDGLPSLYRVHDVPNEEMPKSLIVISDMEIDNCGNRDWTFYDKIKYKYKKHGYDIPNIVFWNVNSIHDVFHADKTRKGVQLCSGQSASVFKQLMACIGYTPLEMMEKVICSERYDCITIE